MKTNFIQLKAIFTNLFSVFGQSTDQKIVSFLNSKTKFKKGNVPTIAHLLPNKFEFYGIVTHPFEIATNLSDSLVTINEYENRVPYDFEKAKQAQSFGFTLTTTDKQGRVIDMTQQSIQRMEWKKKQTWKLSNWNEVCNKNGIAFDNMTTLNTIWDYFVKNGIPYNLNFPYEGVLDSSRFERFCEIIAQDSLHNKIYVYQRPPHAINYDDTLMLMSVSDAIQYFKHSGFKGYICAQDKSFVLYTDNDLQFSLLGSNKALADKLKHEIELIPANLWYKLDQ
jgi:hypothetical protein